MNSERVVFAGHSDIGQARRRNEDAFTAGNLPGAEGWMLLAVADGLAGHARGDWASQRTLELLGSELGRLVAEHGPEAGLREACHRVNWAVRTEARAMGAFGAATTLVLALLQGSQYWWLNVGDSRLYLHTRGELRQLSTDHSWVQEQIGLGRIAAVEARFHPNRNVVTRTIGFEPAVQPDIAGPFNLEPGETLLACSDGLFGPVSDDRIATVVAEFSPDDACRRLIDVANEAGGPDNITVVIGALATT